jgi:hypothetical protein
MGYVITHGECFCCRQIFAFNPVRVPSLRSPISGVREPVCGSCIERVNPLRVANGLAPIVPLPGAYEACHESELP